MSQIHADDIRVAYDKTIIIDRLSVEIPEGKITTIIGANGCGKSTLLKALTRINPLEEGLIFLDGDSIANLKTKDIAKKMALLPQVLEASQGITVYELVSYGRFPHQKYLGTLTKQDRDKIHWAMEVTHTTAFANLEVDSLSGGQRQRVWIAMALAQDTDTIFLDEPTTYLDLNHQLEVLELLEDLNKTSGKTIVMVLHDLNHSARFSDHLIAMKKGQIAYQGSSFDLMTSEVLRDIFAIDAHIVPDPIHNRPCVLTYQLVDKDETNHR